MTLIRLTAAHHAHGKDGVVRHLRVSIVRKLAEGVQDVQARVGNRNESQGEGYSSPQGGLAITQLMPGKITWKGLRQCKIFVTQKDHEGDEKQSCSYFGSGLEKLYQKKVVKREQKVICIRT